LILLPPTATLFPYTTLFRSLEQERLFPSPEAGKVAWLRRVTLDLIGLPPAPREVDAFLADRSAIAYERVVDRLLVSPHYGERMADRKSTRLNSSHEWISYAV